MCTCNANSYLLLSVCPGVAKPIFKHSSVDYFQGHSGKCAKELTQAAVRIQRAFRKYRQLKFEKFKNKKEIKVYPRNARVTLKNGECVLEKFARRVQNKQNKLHISKEYFSEDSLFDRDIDVVLIFGGTDPYHTYGIGRNTGKDIFKYLPYLNTWEFVGELPEPRHHHRVQLLKGRVYVVGGADPKQSDPKHDVVNTVWSLNPAKRIWYKENNLLTPRKHFGIIVLDQCLYVIGGQTTNLNVLKSVEKFNPINNCWEKQPSLPHKIMKMGCTTFKNQIWIAGGINQKEDVLDDVLYFESKTQQWTKVGGFRSPRHSLRLLATPDRLFAIGGATEATPPVGVADVDEWEERNGTWRPIAVLAMGRYGHAVTPLGTQMMVVGGVTPEYKKALGSVECYCLSRKTWVRGISCLPMSVVGHDTATLPPASLMYHF